MKILNIFLRFNSCSCLQQVLYYCPVFWCNERNERNRIKQKVGRSQVCVCVCVCVLVCVCLCLCVSVCLCELCVYYHFSLVITGQPNCCTVYVMRWHLYLVVLWPEPVSFLKKTWSFPRNLEFVGKHQVVIQTWKPKYVEIFHNIKY